MAEKFSDLIDAATFEAVKVLRASMRDGVEENEVDLNRVLDTLVRSVGFLYVVVGAATGAETTALGTPVPKELRATLDAAPESRESTLRTVKDEELH